MSIAETIRMAYPAAIPTLDFGVAMLDDKEVITTWNAAKLGPVPKIGDLEQWAKDHAAELDAAAKTAARLAAYKAESDPLLAEALYDSLKAGVSLAATPWYVKVTEIKERYPLAVTPAVEK